MKNTYGVYLISGNELSYFNLMDMIHEKITNKDYEPIILKGAKAHSKEEYTFGISLYIDNDKIIKITITDSNDHIENIIYLDIHCDENYNIDIEDTFLEICMSAVCGNLCTADRDELANDQLVKVLGTQIGLLISIEN